MNSEVYFSSLQATVEKLDDIHEQLSPSQTSFCAICFLVGSFLSVQKHFAVEHFDSLFILFFHLSFDNINIFRYFHKYHINGVFLF